MVILKEDITALLVLATEGAAHLHAPPMTGRLRRLLMYFMPQFTPIEMSRVLFSLSHTTDEEWEPVKMRIRELLAAATEEKKNGEEAGTDDNGGAGVSADA